MSNHLRVSLLTIGVLITSVNVKAQNISPDRPGIGNGAHIVSPKITYFEGGMEYYNLEFGDQYSFGQVLLRTGLVDGVELRFQLNSFVVQNIGSSYLSGVPDPGVGAKFKIYDEIDSDLRLSGLGSVSIPIGSDRYSSDELVPSASVIGEYSIGDYTSLTANAGYSFGVGSVPDFWNVSVTPGYSLRDSNLGLYAGYAGIYFDSAKQHFIEAGFTSNLKSYLQVDLNTGYEWDGGELFVGAGLALQF